MPPRREIRRVGAKRGRPPAQVVGAEEANLPPVSVSINQPDVGMNPVELNPAAQLNQPQATVGAPPLMERNAEL
ncbi:hypothetical protein LIER_20597 [Lithospermum erythrorhizon]|uniref:Uncharacterized protein n=1 Tax=Lithospermum erythrorhizon TaxID=34254 RepID=A0AAV3QN42_LITER